MELTTGGRRSLWSRGGELVAVTQLLSGFLSFDQLCVVCLAPAEMSSALSGSFACATTPVEKNLTSNRTVSRRSCAPLTAAVFSSESKRGRLDGWIVGRMGMRSEARTFSQRPMTYEACK